MRFVSPFLRHVAYPVLHSFGSLRGSFPVGNCAVVSYHGVLPDGYESRDSFLDGNLVSRGTLRRQLQLLKNRYCIISPVDFRKWLDGHLQISSRAVLITCDDGLLNTLTDMLPILESERVPCLFFVLGASCHGTQSTLWYEELYQILWCEWKQTGDRSLARFRDHWWRKVQEGSAMDSCERETWIRSLRAPSGATIDRSADKRWRLLSPDQLRQVVAAGMEIGAHTFSHPILSCCSDDLARREIEESKRDLERVLGRPVWAFAYPFGNPGTMGDREVRLARDAGYACAFVNTGGGAVDRLQRFALSRAHVTAQMNIGEFEAHVSGLHQRLQHSVRG